MPYAGRMMAGSLLMAGLLLAACTAEEPAAVGDPRAAAGRDEDPAYPAHWEGAYGNSLRMAEEIAGYGGHYYEGNVAFVYVQNPQAQSQTARSVLGRTVRESVEAVPQRVEILKGEYHVLDLIRWHDALGQLLGSEIEGAWAGGLGLRYNRLQLSVLPGTNESVVRKELRSHGIPPEAVEIAERAPFAELDRVSLREPLL